MRPHKGQLIFGVVVGVLIAVWSYRWITATEPRLGQERELQETVVLESRALLRNTLQLGELEIVDPVAPDRKVGRTYVFARHNEWQISGYYRRAATDLWHPYLATLGADLQLLHLKISDTELLSRDGEGVLEVLP